MRGMLTRISGNLLKDSGQCSRGFRGMFEEIPGNTLEDTGECLRGLRFRGMLAKILKNTQKD